MMTIRQFARLCGCNAQTLRYYDRIGLLKPAEVDQWSGYRYYAGEQAVAFVAIKNLQAADFSIDEIRVLLGKSDAEICAAFDRKIAAQKEKLARIEKIKASYLGEKNMMEKIVQSLSQLLLGQMGDFDGLREFGLDGMSREALVDRLGNYMQDMLAKAAPSGEAVTLRVDGETFTGADNVLQKIDSLELPLVDEEIILSGPSASQQADFDPAAFDTVWQRDGWAHAREFIDDMPPLEAGREYALVFQLNEALHRDATPFALFMIGAMLLKHDADAIAMSCSGSASGDGVNHFQLMRKR